MAERFILYKLLKNLGSSFSIKFCELKVNLRQGKETNFVPLLNIALYIMKFKYTANN